MSVLLAFLIGHGKNWPGATPTPERAFGPPKVGQTGALPASFWCSLLALKPRRVTCISLRHILLRLTRGRSRYRRRACRAVLRGPSIVAARVGGKNRVRGGPGAGAGWAGFAVRPGR